MLAPALFSSSKNRDRNRKRETKTQMGAFFTIMIVMALAATAFIMTRLNQQLDSFDGIIKLRRNSNTYHCLNANYRKRSLWELIWIGKPDYQRQLERLPKRLKELNVSETDIEWVPALPEGVEILRAYDCPKLKSLAKLPSTLKELHISECPLLTELGDLPNGLQIMYVWGTAIESLSSVPRELEILDLRCNERLAILPTKWPVVEEIGDPNRGGLQWLNICNCPVMDTISGNLPERFLQDVKKHGVAGWRYNSLEDRIQYAREDYITRRSNFE